jgi:hypothetical protein
MINFQYYVAHSCIAAFCRRIAAILQAFENFSIKAEDYVALVTSLQHNTAFSLLVVTLECGYYR